MGLLKVPMGLLGAIKCSSEMKVAELNFEMGQESSLGVDVQ